MTEAAAGTEGSFHKINPSEVDYQDYKERMDDAVAGNVSVMQKTADNYWKAAQKLINDKGLPFNSPDDLLDKYHRAIYESTAKNNKHDGRGISEFVQDDVEDVNEKSAYLALIRGMYSVLWPAIEAAFENLYGDAKEMRFSTLQAHTSIIYFFRNCPEHLEYYVENIIDMYFDFFAMEAEASSDNMLGLMVRSFASDIGMDSADTHKVLNEVRNKLLGGKRTEELEPDDLLDALIDHEGGIKGPIIQIGRQGRNARNEQYETED